MAYETDTDFGWVKPSRVKLVLPFVEDLVLLLLLGTREKGAVHVTVALDHEWKKIPANFLASFKVIS